MTAKNLFIHKENQILLWNTISKHENFYAIGADAATEWFKSHIENTYLSLKNENRQQMKNKNDIYNFLLSINKKCLLEMLWELNNMQLQQPQLHPAFIEDPIMAGYISSSTQKDKMTSADNNDFAASFEMRQKEYENMFSKKAAPEMDFLEKISDEPINITELVAKYQKEREEMEQQILPKISYIPMPEQHQPYLENNVESQPPLSPPSSPPPPPELAEHINETNNISAYSLDLEELPPIAGLEATTIRYELMDDSLFDNYELK